MLELEELQVSHIKLSTNGLSRLHPTLLMSKDFKLNTIKHIINGKKFLPAFGAIPSYLELPMAIQRSNHDSAYAEFLLNHIGSTIFGVLELNAESNSLRVWSWYVPQYAHHGLTMSLCIRPISATGQRITPSDLSSHHVSHAFRGPLCLCALLHPTWHPQEASIYLATSGEAIGEYVASCASDYCDYFGEFI
jgi:hypothetical protein